MSLHMSKTNFARTCSEGATKIWRIVPICGCPKLVKSHLMPAALGQDLKGADKAFWIGLDENPGKRLSRRASSTISFATSMNTPPKTRTSTTIE